MSTPFTGIIRTVEGDSITFDPASRKLHWRNIDLRIENGLIVDVTEVPESTPAQPVVHQPGCPHYQGN